MWERLQSTLLSDAKGRQGRLHYAMGIVTIDMGLSMNTSSVVTMSGSSDQQLVESLCIREAHWRDGTPWRLHQVKGACERVQVGLGMILRTPGARH